MSRRAVLVAGLAVAVTAFSVGVMVGKGTMPAQAAVQTQVAETPQSTEPVQTQVAPTVDERAAEIKSELVASIVRFHTSLPRDFISQVDAVWTKPTAPAWGYTVARYMAAWAPVARDDVLVGQYLRYIGPYLFSGLADSPKQALLEDRFLDHFSQAIASSGLPPAFPAFTDEEINKIDHSNPTVPGGQAAWPNTWSGRVLLGK